MTLSFFYVILVGIGTFAVVVLLLFFFRKLFQKIKTTKQKRKINKLAASLRDDSIRLCDGDAIVSKLKFSSLSFVSNRLVEGGQVLYSAPSSENEPALFISGNTFVMGIDAFDYKPKILSQLKEIAEQFNEKANLLKQKIPFFSFQMIVVCYNEEEAKKFKIQENVVAVVGLAGFIERLMSFNQRNCPLNREKLSCLVCYDFPDISRVFEEDEKINPRKKKSKVIVEDGQGRDFVYQPGNDEKLYTYSLFEAVKLRKKGDD